jgi:hypothetical protein
MLRYSYQPRSIRYIPIRQGEGDRSSAPLTHLDRGGDQFAAATVGGVVVVAGSTIAKPFSLMNP